jgi:uncharacterized protein YggE
MLRTRWFILTVGATALLFIAALFGHLTGITRAQVIVWPTLVPQPAPAQAATTATAIRVEPAVAGLPRTIVVLGEGQVTAQPGLARIDLGVETVAPTIAEAVETNEATLAKVLASLEADVAPADIHTTSYNVYPERDYDRGPLPPILGYHVTNMVQVTVRDLARLGRVLEAATTAGANQIFGVSFDLDEATRAGAETEARALATASLQAHAEELARLQKVQLGRLISVSEVIGAGALLPYTYGEGAGGGGGPTITPGGLAVTVRLQATYAIGE